MIFYKLYSWLYRIADTVGDMKARQAELEGFYLPDYLNLLDVRNTVKRVCLADVAPGLLLSSVGSWL